MATAGAVILLRGKETKCKFDLISTEIIKVAGMGRKLMKSPKIGIAYSFV